MPKLYFAKKELGVPEGAKVHVRYSYGSIFNNLDNKLTDGVGEGIAALHYAVDYMKNTDTNNLNQNFKTYFEKYFLTDNFADIDSLNNVYAVLLLTKNGIAQTTIKVFSKASNDPDGLTNGYVANYWGGKADQKHRNTGVYHKSDQDIAVFKGDIHMGANAIKDNSTLNNAVLFVHEATHKYASTADFGEKGYTTKQGSYRESGLTTAQALMNADSYGRFAVHFHRAEKKMRQW